MVFTAGLRLADRYRLDTRIGLGGMSEVWRAYDHLLGRPVAVKALAASLASDPALLAAIVREARAAARLTHPHVTQVYDYGEVVSPHGARVAYLVMELVEGRNLADRLSRGPLPWPDAVRVAAQVASGLAAAHRLGIVHHDIKPGNVMLTATGVKILDFGIAAQAGSQPTTGPLLGTPSYTSPERLDGGAADPAGDVYSLGLLLYECLTGTNPAAADDWPQAAVAHRRADHVRAPAVPGLPDDVGAICLACLAADPRQRPSAEAIARRLAAAVGGPVLTPVGLDAPEPAATRSAPPPTLIDPAPADAATRSAGRRIVGSAAVKRPVPAPDGRPATHDIHPERFRLSIVAVAGAVIAAGLALTLIASALRETPDPTGNAAPPPASPSLTTEAPRATEPAPTPTPPATNDGLVAELERLLADAVRAGRLSEDVATDLSDRLADISKELGKGRGTVRQKIEDLRELVARYRDENKIDSRLADRLDLTLRTLLIIVGPGNGNNEDD